MKSFYPKIENKSFEVTAEYPATSSALLKRAGYAVRGQKKNIFIFKEAVYLMKLATRYAVRGGNKFKLEGLIFLSSWPRGTQ